MSSGARRFESLSVEEYLAGEELSEVRHEYVDGRVYAMSGGTANHSRVQINAVAALHSALRGKPCRPYGPDMKVRVVTPGRPNFYYPDVSVVCDSTSGDAFFQENPVVILEVLSHSTRRIDEGEKRDAYFSIPSLQVYLLAEQDQPAVRACRRTNTGFSLETYTDLQAVIDLPEIEASLRLADLYEDVDFTPEPGDPEDLTAPLE
ncbi:Uma2 family endonuclease [Botrimarina sp.]|uniref:Uma2 family endonuclease n=1 Tax=Botrimarina sp. TaxID=2795802 RepID=UPI0032EB840F